MNRAQLEHVIRAAAAIAGDPEIVVVGSQAILGGCPDAPPELCVSADVDLYPRNRPERADLIDGSIGELSPFAGSAACPSSRLPHSKRARLAAVSH